MESTLIENEKQTDASNSPSPVHLLNLLDISLDKVRVVGDLQPRAIKFIHDKSPLEMQFQFIDSETGRFNGYIKTQGDISRLNFEYNPMRARATDSANFWIEWNPNRVTDETVDIAKTFLLPYISDAHLTRLDIAFDFANDLSNAYLLRRSKSKSGVWFGTNGKVETRYFGSERSDKHIKLYNKKKELMDKQGVSVEHEDLWRFEVTLKGKKLRQLDAVFDGFDLVLPDLESMGDIRERAMVFYLIHHENDWNELAQATKAKYRKIIKEASPVNITEVMREALADKKEALVTEAISYLSTALTSSGIVQ